MRPLDPPWGRPLLGGGPRGRRRRRAPSSASTPWADPHNVDPAFTRVRLRTEVLPLLEEVLQGGVADALARTAAQLREDNDALDALAEAFGRLTAVLDAASVTGLPAALRRRVLRRWLLDGRRARVVRRAPSRGRRAGG